jgi:maleylpyruvate isomerase
MKLYDCDISSAASRVRIALALKGLQVERYQVSISGNEPDNRKPDYLQINPQGLVPALLTDRGTLLTQSLAIIEYLEELQPEPALLPADLESRAFARSIAMAIAAEIHSSVTFRVARYLAAVLGAEGQAILAWKRHWIIEGMGALESRIAQHRSGPFCVGEQPTIADIFLFAQAVNAERAGLSIDQWPHIAEIVARLRDIPAFADNGPALPR